MKKLILCTIITSLFLSCNIEKGIFYTLQTEKPASNSGLNQYSTIHKVAEDSTNLYILGNMIMTLEKTKAIDSENSENWSLLDTFKDPDFKPEKASHLSARDLESFDGNIYASFTNQTENRLVYLKKDDDDVNKWFQIELNLTINRNGNNESGSLSELKLEIIKFLKTDSELYILCNDKSRFLENTSRNTISYPPIYYMFNIDASNIASSNVFPAVAVTGTIGQQNVATGFNYFIEKLVKYTDASLVEKYIFSAGTQFYQISGATILDSGITKIPTIDENATNYLKEIISFDVLPLENQNDLIMVNGWFLQSERKRFRNFVIFPANGAVPEMILSADLTMNKTNIDPTELKGTKIFFINKTQEASNSLFLVGTRLGFYDYNPLTLDASRNFTGFSYASTDGTYTTTNKPVKTGAISSDENVNTNFNTVSDVAIISQALYNVSIIDFYETTINGNTYLFALTAGNSLWYCNLGPIKDAGFKIWKRV
ncbi:MAG: hypothetical protein JXR63_02855 [Spirochaetales bacterium]|nr:hypothetical protein [Spirochaetales bacterium]